MLKRIAEFLLSMTILIVTSSLFFEFGNVIVQKLIIIDSNNSYLYRKSFIELVVLISIVTGIPYIVYAILNFFLKPKILAYKIAVALLIQMLFIFLLMSKRSAYKYFG